MAVLGKIDLKKVYSTKDGEKFDVLEDAQIHNRILQFREMIGLKCFKKAKNG
jgi:hypothetical protein